MRMLAMRALPGGKPNTSTQVKSTRRPSLKVQSQRKYAATRVVSPAGCTDEQVDQRDHTAARRLRLMTRADLLCVLPHPALLDSAAHGRIVPLRLREALPRYEMQLFTPARPRRALAPVMARLQQELARVLES
jgi:hypothetical protein